MRTFYSYLISTLFHGAVLLSLAWVVLPQLAQVAAQQGSPVIESRFVEAASPVAEKPPIDVTPADVPEDLPEMEVAAAVLEDIVPLEPDVAVEPPPPLSPPMLQARPEPAAAHRSEPHADRPPELTLARRSAPAALPAETLELAAVPTATGAVERPPEKLPTNPAPAYPRAALTAGWQGRVVLRVLVATSGSVEAVSIRTSSGHDLLDESALRTVRGWRFRPALQGGAPVPFEILVPVKFSIE